MNEPRLLPTDEQGACAHRRVMYRTDDSLDVTHGWWECTMCDQRFIPIRPPADQEGSVGLTKRERLAAMAMQGLMPTMQHTEGLGDDEDCAKLAVRYADALLQELAK